MFRNVVFWLSLGAVSGVVLLFAALRIGAGPNSGMGTGISPGTAPAPVSDRDGSGGVAHEVVVAPSIKQLPYIIVPPEERSWERKPATQATENLRREIPGLRIPRELDMEDLSRTDLFEDAVPLPEANTLSQWYLAQGRLGTARRPDGRIIRFAPQTVLVKFRDTILVAAIRVKPMLEVAAMDVLTQRDDVAFAELNVLEQPRYQPDDPQVGSQWHHQLIGSQTAWDYSLGDASVRIAIVDLAFQMDHPDLAANTVSGWDVRKNIPVTSSTGDWHATRSAGMAAAVINNGQGVAGAANCTILPVVMNGLIADMYAAIIWCADHGVRVVNISYGGGELSTLEEGGKYLAAKANGLLAMPGENGNGYVGYTNQPDIYCISMTDASDRMVSKYGPQIDFAAPGENIHTTTTGSGYITASGTSYSTPLFCGVVAMLFSVNPSLSPAMAVEILRNTAEDLGSPGWDEHYGWGRINFGRAVEAALAMPPRIVGEDYTSGGFSVETPYRPGTYSLWRSESPTLDHLARVENAVITSDGTTVTLLDPEPLSGPGYYSVSLQSP